MLFDGQLRVAKRIVWPLSVISVERDIGQMYTRSLTALRCFSGLFTGCRCTVYNSLFTGLWYNVHGLAAVSSVADSRHTHGSTIAVHAADGRRTMTTMLKWC